MIDFDALVSGPVMKVFGEGKATDATTWPVYRPGGVGDGFALAGAVFDQAGIRVFEGEDGGPPVQNIQPMLGVRLSLFTMPPDQGDTVFIPRVGKLFTVNNVDPDGLGGATLWLTYTDT
jgi:hypothetical protein